MAKKNLQLLLLESVENLGIVGDIVRVKTGFARNYLLPYGLAEFPTPTRIEALKADRAKAQAEQSALRSAREELLGRMESVTVTLVRSCNDKGILYGSVTQRDIADGLRENGYDVGTRSIRLPAALRRIGSYDIPVQFEKDLRTDITLIIEPDQPLEEREEMEFDNEGNLIEKSDRDRRKRKPRAEREEAAGAAESKKEEAAQPASTSA